MSASTLAAILRIVETAARIGRVLGADRTVGFFRALFDGSLTSAQAAEEAARALGVALDLELLRADIELVKLALTVDEATRTVDKAIQWTNPNDNGEDDR